MKEIVFSFVIFSDEVVKCLQKWKAKCEDLGQSIAEPGERRAEVMAKDADYGQMQKENKGKKVG